MSHLVAPLELLLMGGNEFPEETEDAVSFKPRQSQVCRLKSIGIGDGGNEVGMGKIYDRIITSNIQNASDIACIVPSDHLIVASVSNWGELLSEQLVVKLSL